MNPEADGGERVFVAISALEHWSYCPRQCGLIHLDQVFDENVYTIRGTLAHTRADSGVASTERGVRAFRDVPTWSDEFGLVGRIDLLEVRGGVPYPVEFKSGKLRRWQHETIQLCAHALCLEEMLGVTVPVGAVSYLASKRRREVQFTPELRELVLSIAEAIRVMLATERLPPAIADARCKHCSLEGSCLPSVVAGGRRLKRLHEEIFRP